MTHPWRLFRANLCYLERPFLQLVPFGIAIAAVLLLCGVEFWVLYEPSDPEHILSFTEALFVPFALVLGEITLDEFPTHPFLQALHFILPVFGILVILDALVRLGTLFLRRDQTQIEWTRAMCRTLRDHVILFGFGRVGFRTLEQLMALGEDVAIIEKNEHNPYLPFARKHGIPVVIASGREEGLLDDVHVRTAKSIILATNDDLANLELAIDAKQASPDLRVVLRLYDQELAEKIGDSFRIAQSWSTAQVAAPLFATAATDDSVQSSFFLGERLIVVARFRVAQGCALDGETVGALRRNHELAAVCLRHQGKDSLHPLPEEIVHAGDVVTLQCEPLALRRLRTDGLLTSQGATELPAGGRTPGS